MQELIRTNNPVIISHAMALLQSEGIDCFEMDVNMSILEGSIGILPRRIMVLERDIPRARVILTDNDIPLD